MRKTAILSVLALIPVLAMAASDADSTHDAQPAKAANGTAQGVAADVDAIKTYSADKREQATREAKTALDALDARIDALEARIDRDWSTMDQSARKHARATLKTLRRERVKAAEWYGGMKTSSSGAWEQMKQGFGDAYHSLHDAWEKAESEFRHKKR